MPDSPIPAAGSEPAPGSEAAPNPGPEWLRWLALAVAVTGVIVFAWVLGTEWGGVVHSHPAYGILLVVMLVASLAVVWWARRPRPGRTGWRRVARVGLLVLGIGWIAAVAWLRPLGAVEPALTAMHSDGAVEVEESPTQIVLTPRGGASETGVLFQPGALVDPRAYAAVLRPLAESGHTVVIAKPPLGIAFFSLPAFDSTRSAHPEVSQWVVGGHSLGGVVAAMQADSADTDSVAPAVGLLLYASYPAGDIGDSLTASVESISGSEDGLSTPAQIDASRADLPPEAFFTVIDGASHANFGDYGPQRGDGTPTISRDDARTQISQASVQFVDMFNG